MGEPDTIPLDVHETSSKSMVTQLLDVFRGSHMKSAIFLFILFVLVTSDVFVSLILKKINGAVDDTGFVSPYGVIIQGIILVLSYALLNFLNRHDVI